MGRGGGWWLFVEKEKKNHIYLKNICIDTQKYMTVPIWNSRHKVEMDIITSFPLFLI